MSWLSSFASRFLALFRKSRLDQELDEEFRFHLEMEVEENVRRGMKPEEARYAARRNFGGLEQAKEAYRDRRGIPLLDHLQQDFRYAARVLRRSPAFTTVAVLTLGLAIGATSTIFTIVNTILIQPLPYKDPERLVNVGATNLKGGSSRVSVPDFLDWQAQSQTVEQWVGWSYVMWTITGDGEAEMAGGYYFTPGLFHLLGVQPMIGRGFSPEEECPGGDPVVVLLHRLWQRRYGGDPSIVGKTILLHERPHTVVGVMPPGLRFLARESELWVPMAADLTRIKNRRQRGLLVLARLKPEITLAQAQAELDTIARRLERQYPDTNKGWGVRLRPLSESATRQLRPALLLLFGAVGFVLLISWANVTGLLLARTAARQRELAVRAALGARWREVLRLILAESLMLAGLGAVVGVLLAYAGVRSLTAWLPTINASGRFNTIVQLDNIQIDGWVLGFTVAVSLLAAVAVGVFPARQAVRVSLNEVLKDTGTSSLGGLRTRKVLNLLVVGEVAVAFVLVIGAGLMIRSFLRLQNVNSGFRKDHVLAFRTFVVGQKYRTPERGRAFYQTLFERLEWLPGVQSAAAINHLPMIRFFPSLTFSIQEQAPTSRLEQPHAFYYTITPGYFRTMGIPLRRGRVFRESDMTRDTRVTIINDELARRYFPGTDPIGRHLVIGPQMRAFEIVGVVGSVRISGLEDEPEPVIFYPHSYGGFLTVVVRTTSDPLRLAPFIRPEVRSLDPDVAVHNIRTLEQTVDDSTWHRRAPTQLLGSLAGLALFMAALGAYGVMQYSVAQQTHEIGIRMALGAHPNDVLKMVLRRGLKLTAIGVAIGLAASLALTDLIANQLYSIEATDPLTFVAVTLTLLGVALLACYIPARRAAKVDPMVALRHE